MSSAQYFEEIFKYPLAEFKQHLEDPRNAQIIFSGKYGTGKTRFLADFFAHGNQMSTFGEDRYNVITLTPVNYSISTNEDILKFIKYDIIIEFLKNKTELDEFKKKRLTEILPGIAKKRGSKIIKQILGMIPKVGKDIKSVYESAEEIIDDYAKENETDGDKLISFIDEIESDGNSIYANSTITALINNILQKDKRESILIVDDIDRLDPDHVFRILNVFAAHFNEGHNRMKFSKVILVCDFNNIRSLFHHRYGSEADFAGYIDKFYSSEIFYFDNRKAVSEIIKNVLQSLQFMNESKRDDTASDYFISDGFLQHTLEILTEHSLINLRSIIKMIGKRIDFRFLSVIFSPGSNPVPGIQFPMLLQMKILRDFAGDYWSLMKAISISRDRGLNFSEKEKMFGLFLLIINDERHSFRLGEKVSVTFQNTEYVVVSKTIPGMRTIRFAEVSHAEDDSVRTMNDATFWYAFEQAIARLNRQGLLY